MAPVQPGKKPISREALVRRLKALGETTAPTGVSRRPIERHWKPADLDPRGAWGYRRLQNGWLTRNEGERRLGGMLLLSGYFHGLVSLLLFHGFIARFPAEGLPLWMHWQPWVGSGFGLLLAAGGAFSLFWARNCVRSARRVFVLYLLFFLGNGLWVLQNTARASAIVYPLSAGLLTFLILGSVCNFERAGFFGRRRRISS